MYDVEQVGISLQAHSTQPALITIPIDVGYGEINGSKIGGSALGESETNLLQVNYSTFSSHYPANGLSNNLPNTLPAGNFYVSDAEAQALGIITTTPIGFSSQSGIFDYNTNISNDSGIR
jgi:hypothetical protein